MHPYSPLAALMAVLLAYATSALLARRFGAPAPDGRYATIDGLRGDYPDGFGLIRASNTTPVLVLRFEGHTQAALERIQHAMEALLHSVKPDARFEAAAH